MMQVNINLIGQQQQQQGSVWPVATPAFLPAAAGAAAAAAAACEEGELQRLSQRMSTSMNISDTHGTCRVWCLCLVFCWSAAAFIG
jgi:hypothetical protein